LSFFLLGSFLSSFSSFLGFSSALISL
jgi:hypothetical protein